MDERQYQRAVSSGPRYEPAALFSGDVVDRLLRVAARGARRTEVAAGAWARLVPPAVRDGTAVEAFEGGTLLISVMEPGLHYLLRSEQALLARQLAELLPGLRRLRFIGGRPGVGGERAGE